MGAPVRPWPLVGGVVLAGLVIAALEEATKLYDRITHREAKWLAYQADQRRRMSGD